MHVAAVGTEDEVLGPERRGEPGRDRLLPEREMRRALDEPLEEQVLRPLLEQAGLLHHPVHPEANRLVGDRWGRLGHSTILDQYSLATMSSSHGKSVMICGPAAVTTTSSSIRAADRPSVAGQ